MAEKLTTGQKFSLLGTGLTMVSDLYGGYLQSKVYKANAALAESQGDYSSAVSQFNAAVARANAEAIRAVADLDIERQKREARRFISRQAASYAKAGVRSEGSPLLVMIESAQEAKLDIAITDYNASLGMMRAQTQARGFEVSGEFAKTMGKASATMLRASGKYQRAQKTTRGITSLLTKVASYQ